MLARILASAFIMAAAVIPSHAEGSQVLLHAAGSLRDALTDAAHAFETVSGEKVTMKYGASDTLNDAIAGGRVCRGVRFSQHDASAGACCSR